MSEAEKPRPTDPLVGQCVDAYRVERALGRGGMGVVYVARHVQLGHLVAIKVLRSEALDDPRARERFLREAQALARVKAPGLVDIIAVGETADGIPYIVMELLEGQTLRFRLQQAPQQRMEVNVALALGEQLATTLAQLHEKEVIHRDLKPENVILVADAAVPGGERTKLLDLGIAKLRDDLVTLTRTEHQPGTQPYMSPEACAGERDIDGQADIYSLGCVLYELLCGRPPFAVEDGGNLMLKHIQNRPLSPRTHVPELPPAVEQFVLDLLEKDPSARPSAVQAIERLRSLRQNPQRGVWRWSHWRRSHRSGLRVAFLVGMPIFAVLGALLLLLWLRLDIVPFFRAPMVKIPGGTFVSGSTKDERTEAEQWAQLLDRPTVGSKYADTLRSTMSREQPAHQVAIPEFWIDRHEVTNQDIGTVLEKWRTNGQIIVKDECPNRGNINEHVRGEFCAYDGKKPLKRLSHDAGRDPALQGIFWDGSRISVDSRYARFPAVTVSWNIANLYCNKIGKRLPTSDEYEYLLRNGSRRSKFAWGDARPNCTMAILERQFHEAKLSKEKIFYSCNPNSNEPILAPAGSMKLDQNMWGVLDLAGSVQEWTADELITEPTSTAKSRILRGAGWNQDFLSVRAAAVFKAPEDAMMDGVGFRCAKDISSP